MSRFGRTASALSVLLFVSSWSLASDAHAQVAPSTDLGIEVSIDPEGVLSGGTVAQLRIEATNHGPEASPSVGVVTSPYPFLDFELFSLVPSEPNPCVMYYDDFIAPPGSGEPSYLVAAIIVGPLLPLESRVCTVRVDISPAAAGRFDLGLSVLDGQVQIQDPNPLNDSVVLRLSLGTATSAPSHIPTSNWISIMALTAIIGAMALFHLALRK